MPFGIAAVDNETGPDGGAEVVEVRKVDWAENRPREGPSRLH